MFNDNEYDTLLSNLLSFSPTVENEDLFIPPDIPSSPEPSNLPAPSQIRIVSQNTMRSNAAIHSLLNISSAQLLDGVDTNPFTSDVILIQEPWYGRIGIDITSGQDILGLPSHRDWISILPPFGDLKPDVAIYVPTPPPHFQVQTR